MSDSRQSTDLTSEQSVAASQRVYDRITSGQARDVSGELNQTHGRQKGK